MLNLKHWNSLTEVNGTARVLTEAVALVLGRIRAYIRGGQIVACEPHAILLQLKCAGPSRPHSPPTRLGGGGKGAGARDLCLAAGWRGVSGLQPHRVHLPGLRAPVGAGLKLVKIVVCGLEGQ